jgi:GNAT superfamily N-acetyltransferase
MPPNTLPPSAFTEPTSGSSTEEPLAPLAVRLRIEPLNTGHRVAWDTLWRAYLDFYESTLPAAQFDLTWSRLLDPQEPVHGWLAALDGQPVGLAHGIVHRSCWTPDNYLYLQDLYVAPQTRGQGVGAALIQHLMDRCPELNCNRVHWLTQADNTAARALYDRVAHATGFVQYKKTAG